MIKKSKVSASQIYLCVSILAILIGLFIIAVVSEHAPVFAALKEKGRTAEATVTGREIKVTESTSTKGKKRRNTSHFITVSYDCMSVTPHAEAADGQPLKPSQNPSVVSADIQVATAEYESLTPGSKTRVTYLPAEMFKPKLTASVQNYTPVWQVLTAVVLLLTGVATAWLSWKKRRPKMPPVPVLR